MEPISPENTIRKYCNISCTDVPLELLDKFAARAHFRKFGHIVRIHLRPKSRSCQIEYTNQESAQLASFAGNEYNGEEFNIVWGAEPFAKKKPLRKDPDPDWTPDDPEVKAELEAMGTLYPKKNTPRIVKGRSSDLQDSDPSKKVKRKWQTDTSSKDKVSKRASGKITSTKKPTKKKLTTEHLELLKIIRMPAFTTEEKYKVLDSRDKLIRLHTKKQSDLSKAKVTIGVCPDMCPEKERLMREVQHQVAIYEQGANGKGMNPNLAVKQYSRSSADQEVPLPHELRPVHVLQLTMNYLMHKIMDLCDLSDVNIGEWYHFLWDRTRGIRKDITQQELCCLGSVELVEQCARFHIHCSARLAGEEPSIFDQKINTENLTKCLQSLKYMYHDLNLKGIRCPHEPEFRAYIILLNLNDGNFMWEVQQLHWEIQKSPEVKFAIQVYSAIDKNNYVRFFKLVKTTTYLNACILLRYFVQVRLKALKTILKSYSPRAPYTQFPLQELMKILAFENILSVVEFVEYYGLKINEETTHVILDRKSFYSPELPFALDRAVNVVESKRRWTVGETVFGGALPQPLYSDHIPHNSFNEEGFLTESKELLDEFKEAELETQASEKIDTTEKPAPEIKERPKNVFANVPNPEVTERKSTNIFGTVSYLKEPSTSQPTDASVKPTHMLEKEQRPHVTSGFQSHQPFKFRIPKKSGASDIFGQPADVVSSKKSIFGSPIAKTEPFSFSSSKLGSVFGQSQTFTPTTSNLFSQPPSFGSTSASGGFKFDLKIPEKKDISPSTPLALEDQPMEVLEAQKLKLQQQLEEQKRILEEKKREAEEALKKKKAEQKLLEEKQKQKEEEEKRRREELLKQELTKLAEMKRKVEEEKRLEEQRKRKEEEKKRREEQLRLEEIKRKEKAKMEEIATAVTQVMNDLINQLEENLKCERLQEIKENIKNWKLKLFVHKWRSKIESKKRKRKIIETSPVWISTRSADREASQLFTGMQELTLQNIKRYKLGKPIDLELPKRPKIDKIDFYKLSQSLLNTVKNETKLSKEIFWKVTISLPDFREMKHGLPALEDILTDYFEWKEDKYGTTALIKMTKLLSYKVTCSIERKQGVRTFENDSNGLLFVAKNINNLLISRVKESVKNLRKNVSVPVCIQLLHEPTNNEIDQLSDVLKQERHICNYIIIKDAFEPVSFIHSIEENLSLLAMSTKPPPNLLLNTLSNFLRDNLCSDLWNYVTSYGKWNHLYKKCLQRPNVVINLFNEALERLKNIVNSSDIKEYPDFPEEFQDYLTSKIPEILPCDYKYFPKFWNKDEYIHLVSNEIKSLQLPEYKGTWPPENELELEKDICNYCSFAFPENEKIFYKIMSVILKEFDPNEDFEKIRKVSWVNIIETITLEKIEKADFSLRKTEFYSKSIFNQLILVYDPEDVTRFSRDPWFYITNPLVSSEMKQIGRQIQQIKSKKTIKLRERIIDEEKIEIDLDQTLKSLLHRSVEDEENVRKNKATINNLEFLLNDLEDSINIQKKISERFQNIVQSVLLDV
ncbi:uncharacterized protein LOC108732612 [Agrilus planipennis]|uniref:Germinal-center associated nuclear protein n=1 Tax=Agrilus planipennis TaxID=224129 RepID=A0A1W4WFX0_AGRPL|nr:uncharacterized protein LOC108732612 [Agrilus planipennis]